MERYRGMSILVENRILEGIVWLLLTVVLENLNKNPFAPDGIRKVSYEKKFTENEFTNYWGDFDMLVCVCYERV